MNQPSRRVTVVIPTYNRRSSLAKIIRPVLDDLTTGEVIVVVDGCNDGSMELLGEWALREPRIKPVYQKNSGAAAARQRGVEEAQFDVVVLLDDDVMATEGLIASHEKWHPEGANRLVLGYMPTHLVKPRMPGQTPTILYAEDYENTCSAYENDPRQILKNLWAGNMSMSRRNALLIGFRADQFLPYHEDMRFGVRCQEAGIEPVFDRSLLAWHWHGGNLRKLAADSRRSGEGRAEMCRDFPELSNEFNPLLHLSWQETLIARLLGTAKTRFFAAPLVMASIYVAGRLRAWRTELILARVLRLIELSYGFQQSTTVNVTH
jgi:glycosyltransferase involved in cell wall biosynthesis